LSHASENPKDPFGAEEVAEGPRPQNMAQSLLHHSTDVFTAPLETICPASEAIVERANDVESDIAL
jgi:hypothetical protein